LSAGDVKEKQPGDLEKSLTVLAKLKDLEFHSRANMETLAQLSLTVEEELKQREFLAGGERPIHLGFALHQF
jgi:hypothetical protein